MSANLDLVRSLFEAWERGDYSSTGWADPQIEFVIADGPAPGSWQGLAGLVDGYRDFLSAWHGHSSHPESFRELDDERVLVLAHARGQAKRTRMDLGQMQTNVAVVYHLRDGKVVRLVLYLDRDCALADLGLEG